MKTAEEIYNEMVEQMPYAEFISQKPYIIEAINIGKPAAQESYLVKEKIIEAAKRTGCQAVSFFLTKNTRFTIFCYIFFTIFKIKRSTLATVSYLKVMSSVKCVTKTVSFLSVLRGKPFGKKSQF